MKKGKVYGQLTAVMLAAGLCLPLLYGCTGTDADAGEDWSTERPAQESQESMEETGQTPEELEADTEKEPAADDIAEQSGLAKSNEEPAGNNNDHADSNEDPADTGDTAERAKDDPVYERFLADELTVDGMRYSEIFSFMTEDFGEEPVCFYYDVDEDGRDELLVSTLFYGYYIYDVRGGELFLLDCGDGTAAVCGVYKGNGHVYVSHSDFSHAGRRMLTLTRYDGNGDVKETIEIDAEYWDNENDMYDENSDFSYNGQKITMQEY
nr:hypothetical protein [Lachnospiraceae bacterium]